MYSSSNEKPNNSKFIVLINKRSNIIIRISPKVEVIQAKQHSGYTNTTSIPLRRIRSSKNFI
jgi:hypothetical protein